MTLVIDGSHMRASSLDLAIIDFAMKAHGFTLVMPSDLRLLDRAKRDDRELVSDLSAEEGAALRDMADEAVHFMSDDQRAFYVEESCLWMDSLTCRVYDEGERVGCCCEHEGCCGE